MTRVVEDLLAAKALVDTPDKWIKGSFSYELVDQEGGSRMCYCTLGAMSEVTDNLSEDEGIARFDAMKEVIVSSMSSGRTSIASFNDNQNTTHEDVMNLFDRAINAAGS